MSELHEPVVGCTLSGADHERRLRLWEEVTARAMRSRSATPAGVRLEFSPDHETAHLLLDLVVAERECCAWAMWTFTSGSVSSRVEVASHGAGPLVLQKMFGVVS